jgi:alpha-glucosidase
MSETWWKGAVLYEVYVRSFSDSNGDGVGDLAGIEQRLDYLVELGVDVVWLTPFFQSPMRDFGYDVADYRSVDPQFGDLDDFRRLLEQAHEKGLRIMIDQVWSHSSSDHAWFKESRSSRDNPKADWYVWADANADGTPPNNWLSLFGGSAWTWDTRRRQYYLHNFLSQQPDLNFHNPDVQDAILDVARFWFGLGVDGFRLDVCNLYFHDPSLADNPVHEPGHGSSNPHNWQFHRHCRSRPENINFLKRLRHVADDFGDRILLGEIIDDGGPDVLLDYTEGEDRLHMAYSFDLLRDQRDAPFLNATFRSFYGPGKGWPCWAIGNHDSVRVASRWGEDQRQLRLYAAMQMALRGNPCIYQGEELGLPQAIIPFEKIVDPVGIAMWPDDPGRDGCRTPMPWTDKRPSAGFSESADPWLPIPKSHLSLSASAQMRDAESLLLFYRRLLALRRDEDALKCGASALDNGPEKTLVFRRSLDKQEICCVFNLSSDEVVFEHGEDEYRLIFEDLIVGVEARSSSLRLDPWSFVFLKRTVT